ncbi:MAG TPA: hypothetical protein PK280_13055 [Planctomycetota bacterium]|nr:hypothetical protein [Planctomycetota bacterium]
MASRRLPLGLLTAALAVAAALLAAAGCGSSSPASPTPDGGRAPGAGSAAAPGATGPALVRRGRFELRVSETGEFRPLRCRVMLAKVGGKIDWLIPEGQAVKKGDKLFSLDSTGTKDWLTRDSNELEAAVKNLQEVRGQVKMERETIELDLKARESNVKLAETRQAEVLAGATAAAVKGARATLEAARVAAADARAAADSDARMAKSGYLSAAEAEASRLAAGLADIEQERATIRLALLEAGATREQREAARLDLERAGEDLAQAGFDAERRRADLNKRVTDAEAAVANLERSVARARRDLAAREVFADADGVVIYRGMGHRGEEKPEVGSRIWPGAGVLDVADLSSMKIRTQLAEQHIRHLAIGSVLRVSADSVPGAELDAKVVWIDRWSRDRSTDLAKADRGREGLSGVKVFALEAALAGHDARIRPGFRGKADFRLMEVPEALIVPRTALYGSGSDRFVLVAEGDSSRRVAVEILAEDEREAAVRGELSDGQRLLTRGEM